MPDFERTIVVHRRAHHTRNGGCDVHSLLALEMAVSANPDRVAVQHGDDRITFAALLSAAWQVPEVVGDATALVYVGPNSLAFPIALFGAAAADVPCIPLNYRLSDEQLLGLLDQHEGALVVADADIAPRLAAHGHRVLTIDDFVTATTKGGDPGFSAADGEEVWLLLYTSGTTAAPKAAILRHRHITSYVIGSVEFAAAEDGDAALVSVPPYHIAGVSNLMSNLYLGRRIVYLDRFDAQDWVDTVAASGSPAGWSCPRCWPASATPSRRTPMPTCSSLSRCHTAGRAPVGRWSSGS